MRRTEEPVSWVVYRAAVRGRPDGMTAVCEQGEWEAMERAQPGQFTLICGGITNEGEAERLARVGTASEATKKRSVVKRPMVKTITAAPTTPVP